MLRMFINIASFGVSGRLDRMVNESGKKLGRVGYFTVSWRDLGKFRDDEVWQRYVTRWNLEKADPSLKLSPPKEPIVFYLEHTVPVRYRRFDFFTWEDANRVKALLSAVK